MSSDLSRIAESLAQWRRVRRLTQDEVAEAVGVHRQAVSNWERGVHEPTARNLDDLAKLYGTTAKLIRGGFMPGNAEGTVGMFRSSGQAATLPIGVAERAPPYGTRTAPRMPPRAYQLVFDHCSTLEQAGVPEDVIEEARRLMSGETFNTLRKHMADERDEDGWVKDVQAAWVFIRDSLKAQGFDL